MKTIAENIKQYVSVWNEQTLIKASQSDVLHKKVGQIDEKIAELNAMKKQIAICIQNVQNH